MISLFSFSTFNPDWISLNLLSSVFVTLGKDRSFADSSGGRDTMLFYIRTCYRANRISLSRTENLFSLHTFFLNVSLFFQLLARHRFTCRGASEIRKKRKKNRTCAHIERSVRAKDEDRRIELSAIPTVRTYNVERSTCSIRSETRKGSVVKRPPNT